ncbi:hypothetical protein QJS04_geneDACA015384 [Acorus gramineus]|uniref:Uncharacterized protein n=1 Tax=Acorus gramineus TaxID=55184 RepID=A0AAV9A5Z5_ACOGR|nr:hypothetical protein QJS04_geneDACA015384 [Acorus gramineus]
MHNHTHHLGMGDLHIHHLHSNQGFTHHQHNHLQGTRATSMMGTHHHHRHHHQVISTHTNIATITTMIVQGAPHSYKDA